MLGCHRASCFCLHKVYKYSSISQTISVFTFLFKNYFQLDLGLYWQVFKMFISSPTVSKNFNLKEIIIWLEMINFFQPTTIIKTWQNMARHHLLMSCQKEYRKLHCKWIDPRDLQNQVVCILLILMDCKL